MKKSFFTFLHVTALIKITCINLKYIRINSLFKTNY